MRYWTTFATSAALMLAGSAFAAGDDHGARCRQESIDGNWGFQISGTAFTSTGPVPAAVVGLFTIDRRGAVTGRDTTSLGGQEGVAETFDGTLTVNDDCTGSATITGTFAGVTHFDFVLVAKRQEMLLLRTDQGTVIFGSARRQ